MAVESRRKQNMSIIELYNWMYQEKIKINKETGCHEWQGYKNDLGYGTFQNKGRPERVHRFIYECHNNIKLTPEQHVLHECDNPVCCNIEHLFLGDQSLNMKDKVAKGRQGNKLTPVKVEEIKVLLKEGQLNQREIAEIYNVHKTTIHLIKKGKIWND